MNTTKILQTAEKLVSESRHDKHGDKIMSEVSGDFKLGFNLHQMKQGANDRFKAADIDGNEVVSKQEFSDFMEQRGFDTNKTKFKSDKVHRSQ